jgi:muconolactone delta-isomerase
MDYLVMYTQGPNPPAEAVDTLAAGSMEWAKTLIRKGKIELTYLFPDGGGFAVFKADSVQELQELIHSNPASPFLRHQAFPCMDVDPGLESLRQKFGSGLQQAARMAASGAGGDQPQPRR